MSSRPFVSSLSPLALLLVAAACGGGQGAVAPPVAPATPAPSAAPVAAAPASPPGPGQWDAWGRDQKLAYMKSAVMPQMGAAFQALDAAHYASPRCNLCHVAGAKDGSFKMPDPGLPKLPANPAEFKALATKDPKMFDFMAKTVVPQMAALLGEHPFDMATKTGLGCFECHTKG